MTARAAMDFNMPNLNGGSDASQGVSMEMLRSVGDVQGDAPGGVAAVQAPGVQAGGYELPEGSSWRYSEFVRAVEEKQVEKVRFSRDGQTAQLTTVDGRRAVVSLAPDPDLLDLLARNDVDISVSESDPAAGGVAGGIGSLLFPLIGLAGLFFLFRRAQGGQGGQRPGGPGGGPFGGFGGGGPMDFGKSTAKVQMEAETGVTFEDVAGIDQAKLELREIVDFLKNPDKFTALGAKIPRGCLLAGPPGTGKTLLAKAVAGEAGVPFFSCSASEFVEIFVGVGASRVRDLFKQAQEKAPCIIFIDEIDAVGRQRGAGMGGGNDEREQTINQLLTEMDGFDGNAGVIVLAATNRADVLDSALLRPGRFDRQVQVMPPDVQGRIKVLKVHSRGKTLSPGVDLEKVARRTPGFSGADLQNLMNEAAILAARRDLKEISNDEISDALERIIAGAEKKGAVISDYKKKLVAYHEGGHALAGALMPEYDPVQKVSIVPRGAAGGLTFFAPSEERLESGLYSRSYLENQLVVALGGRVAEELIFGEDSVTTGASNDMMQVTRVASAMVKQYGFSDAIGQIAIESGGGGGPFMGNDMGRGPSYGPETAAIVDAEVMTLVKRAYDRCKDLMTKNIDVLHGIAATLIEKEVIDGQEVIDLLEKQNSELYLV